MGKLWWAALCAAGVMACAGQAGAAVMVADFIGEYASVTVPLGFLEGPNGGGCGLVQITRTATTEEGYCNAGGLPWHATFVFDTDLGVLSTTPGQFGSQTLTWSAASGTPSPILSGIFTGVGLRRDLATATTFSVTRSPDGVQFFFSNADFSLGDPGFNPNVPDIPNAVLSTPFVSPPVYEYLSHGQYRDSTFDLRESFDFSATLTPIAAPEPSTWVMLILGFGVTGAALRRSKRFVTGPEPNA